MSAQGRHPQYRRQHRDGERPGLHRRHRRSALPRLRCEDRQGALGDELPANGHSTPITYMGKDGEQYVVIAAAAERVGAGMPISDSLVAYKLVAITVIDTRLTMEMNMRHCF